MKTLLLVLSLLVTTSCSEGSVTLAPEPEPDVSGRWVGFGDGFGLDLVINQSPTGELSGGGRLTGTNGSIHATIESGVYTHPTMQMTVEWGSYREKLSILGTMAPSGDRLESVVAGQYHEDSPITLERVQ